jgi:flavorubredoxin
MIINRDSGTRVDAIADGIYRIATPIRRVPGGFSYNQYLIADEEPLLFHTGPRSLFPLVREAVAAVLPPARLRHIAFSHFEADECGARNEFLALSPAAAPLCGKIAAMVSVNDVADRRPRALDDGDSLSLGSHEVQWLFTPHLPHAWEAGLLFEKRTRTLFCSDLFTCGGADHPPLSESDIIEPSEAFRHQLDYFSHAPNAPAMIERLAALEPTTLALMHGPAWRGDGGNLLRALSERLMQ